ncbi:sciellin isoform X2 [Seriola aureovittata]|uniref:sciellin isoform X2 n=1 Tax=Seriola aureovittata TaxID=2871759 RepID=UPI0024BDD4F5|nr:sciellin isoform X2 [Seriola aureovittata]
MSRYTSQTSRSTRPSQAIEDSKKKSSLLKDNSWIKRADDEDEDVDRDPNFGKSVLSRYRSNESLERFSGSQDELRSSTLPSSKTTTSYTKSSYSSLKSDSPSTTTTSIITNNGKTTETTTTTQSLRSPVIKSPTKTDMFTERVLSSSKGTLYSNISPTRTTKVTETTVTSIKGAEDKLYDTPRVIPTSVKDDLSPTDSKTTVSTTETVVVKSRTDTNSEDKLYDTLIPTSIKGDVKDSKTTVSSTETVTVKSSTNGDDIKTTTTTRTSSLAEDDLYDTLLPKGISSNLMSPVSSSITKRETVTVESSRGGDSPSLTSPSSTIRTSSYSLYSDDSPSTRTSSYTISTKPSYEYTSITSPTTYTSSSYRSSSRSDDTDSIYSTSSMKSLYTSSERTVHEKDLCTYCRKPFVGDAKMVLDDLKINCHASCFKCEVCSSTLGHLKAGDSMWIYKRMVHCENCFEITREKWRR